MKAHCLPEEVVDGVEHAISLKAAQNVAENNAALVSSVLNDITDAAVWRKHQRQR